MKKYIRKELFYLKQKDIRYFSPLELENLPYINTSFFIDAYFNEDRKFGIDRRNLQLYCLNNLQLIFNKIINTFLQDIITKKFIYNQLHKYLIFREIFLDNKYSVSPPNIFSYKTQAHLILQLYKDLNELKKQINPVLREETVIVKNKFNYDNFKNLGWQYSAIHFLQEEVCKKLSKYIYCFLIHGSFATADFLKNWSDLDGLIILNDFCFENEATLYYLQKHFRKFSFLCYKIEPLAHHKFMFLTRFDLDYYPSFTFPPILYSYGISLFGESKININLRSDKYEKIQIMSNFVNYFRNKILENKYSQDFYHFKNDLAHLMLWPSLLLQAKDIYIYKKYSFQAVKKEFFKIDFTIVDLATKMMREWSRPNVLRYYPNFLFTLLPFYFNRILINRYIKYLNILPLPQISREKVEIITKKALLFLENSFNLILQDLKK